MRQDEEAFNVDASRVNTNGNEQQPILKYERQNWSLRSIKWSFVLANQQWAMPLFTLFIVVPIILAVYVAAYPRHRDYYPYDATISFPERSSNTIPAWVAVLVPWLCFLITMVASEFIMMAPVHGNITNALTVGLHFAIDIAMAWVFSVTLTEVFKKTVGMLRPHFLTTCQPVIPSDYQIAPFNWGNPSDFPCSNPDTKDARQSWPSGHSSTCMTFAAYNAVYLLWSGHYRHRASLFSRFVRNHSVRWAYFLKDMGQMVPMFFILLQVSFAFGVGASRMIDYKHSSGDVAGGLLLGLCIGLVYAFKAVPSVKYIPYWDQANQKAIFPPTSEAL